MRENNKKSILFLHVAVMLFGFSGVLAQYVQVPAVLVRSEEHTSELQSH